MQPENLEPRVIALEGQVGNLRDEVQATKVDVAAVQELASAVDRDVSEMRGFRRATIASINALREDMVDMRGEMTDMRQEMRSKLAITAAGQQHIVELIQQVIDAQGDSNSA